MDQQTRTARDGTGLQCLQCGKPLGFPVACCPFCGVAQRGPAQPAADPTPAAKPATPPALGQIAPASMPIRGAAATERRSEHAKSEPPVVLDAPPGGNVGVEHAPPVSNGVEPPDVKPPEVSATAAIRPPRRWGRYGLLAAVGACLLAGGDWTECLLAGIAGALVANVAGRRLDRRDRARLEAARSATVRPAPRLRRYALVAALLLWGAVAGVLYLRARPVAYLTVSFTPPAPGNILIDGAAAGAPGVPIKLPPGPHTLGFAAQGFAPLSVPLDLAAGARSTLSLPLTPLPALLSVSADPREAVIRLDDRVVEATREELRVPAGRHRLTAALPRYATATEELSLDRGERRTVRLTLAPLVPQVQTVVAPAGRWSEPLPVPPKTEFTLTPSARIRLRAGGDVYLVEPGTPLNLGDVAAASLQLKAVDDRPVDVRVTFMPAR